MRFLFLINHQLINTIKQEAFQQNQAQLPVQIVNQTPQKQHANQKSQKATLSKAEKPVSNIEQQQQRLLEEHQKQKFEQQKMIMEEQRQKMLQQQQDEELEQQLKLLQAEEEEHNQRQQNL